MLGASQEVKELASFNYIFPALRGIQAGREYYTSMCPMRLIPKLFIFDEEEIPPELRAQRVLNKGRIPQLTSYITENPRDYVFSAITASIDGKVEFRPISETDETKIGLLIVPMSSRLIINDGQHRRAAIEEALKIRPELGKETISVVFFIDAGLKKSQQMFSDLNKHAIRPTTSLGILYDHKDPMGQLVIRIAQVVPLFKNKIELEKTTISNRSLKLFTLSNAYQATRALLGKRGMRIKTTREEEELAAEFWNEVAKHIPEWQLLLENKVSSGELRKNFVHSHGLVLHALGIMGHDLIAKYPNNWKSKLRGLRNIDWSRSNTSLWEGRAMMGGRISRSPMSIVLTTNVLKQAVGLELTPDEKKAEKKRDGGKV